MSQQIISAGTTPLTAVTGGLIKFTANSGVSIQGIVATATDTFWVFENASTSGTLSFNHQSTGATAANRIITPNGGTINAAPGASIWGYYDTNTGRNRILGQYINVVSSPLVVSSGGILSLPAANTATSGYLSLTDWNYFNSKIGADGGLGYAYGVPFYRPANTNPPALTAGEFLNYNEENGGLGVGLLYSDVAATLDVSADQALEVATPAAITATLTEFVLPTAPTFSVAQVDPDIGALTNTGTSAVNIGAGGYSVNDLVDYVITPYDNTGTIIFGQADLIVTGLTDATDSFDVTANYTLQTCNFTVGGVTVSRQVNGGGYNDYQRFASITNFTDANSGWTAGTDPDIANRADDFVANGTDYTGVLTAYEAALDPDGGTVVSVTAYDPAFVDDSSGNAYKMLITGLEAGTNTYRFTWPGTRNYDISLDSADTFIGGPSLGSSGAPVITPTTYGYLSNGTNLNITYTLYAKELHGVDIYSATGAVTVGTLDPNTGLYYYNILDNITVDGKILYSGPAGDGAVDVEASDVINDNDFSKFSDDDTVTPDSYYSTAFRVQAHGTVTGDESSITYKSIDT